MATQGATGSVRRLDVTPLEHLGARVEGVDLSTPIDEATFGGIYRAFLDHRVLSIPGQRLSSRQVLDVSARFGPLEAHVKKRFHHPDTPLMLVLSNVVEAGRAIGARDGGTFWHSDMSFAARPCRATLLYGIQIPDEGGDTLLADLTRAYEDLPDRLKTRLEGLQGVHDYAKADEISAAQGGQRSPLTEEEKKRVPRVTHPVVRTHPETGRKAIYITPGYTRCIDGLPEAESAALMDEIFAHCLQPQYQLRYRWRAGDVVIWDNAAVMHSATTLYLPADRHRTLWRTVISGDVPF